MALLAVPNPALHSVRRVCMAHGDGVCAGTAPSHALYSCSHLHLTAFKNRARAHSVFETCKKWSNCGKYVLYFHSSRKSHIKSCVSCMEGVWTRGRNNLTEHEHQEELTNHTYQHQSHPQNCALSQPARSQN